MTRIIHALSLLCLSIWTTAFCFADSAVIIPAGRQSPDPSELSAESMIVRVVIDNGHATVRLQEVFQNKTAQVLEGTYSLALPGDATISEFAVWDDVTRIPGVILERKRATELYNEIRNEAIDPGLLESGEITESNAPGDARHSSEFSVKVVPIPAYGCKRIEAEYRQNLPLNQLSSEFVFPLKPSTYAPQRVGKLSISIEIRSPQSFTASSVDSKSYPLRFTARTPHLLEGSFEGTNVLLNDDFSLHYSVENDQTPRVQAYRHGESSEPGYFEAGTILQAGKAAVSEGRRTVLVLFDSSLSMQWEKLYRSFQALETILRGLQPSDRFNVLVFNSEVTSAYSRPTPATSDAIAKALDFVRDSRLRGGTNLEKTFDAAFAESTANTYIVLLSDGEPTEGTISPAHLAVWLDRSWSALAAERRPHIYVLAIGDDANVRLMRQFTTHAGVFEQVNSTEPLDFKLAAFVHKIGLTPLETVNLSISPPPAATLVYRLPGDNFPGSRTSWVGEYKRPGNAEFTVTSTLDTASHREAARVTLPAVDTEHAYLPPTWARARVDALLEKIDREGEDKATIEEIIRFSRKYNFVTPYTSFLAAPRSLLRPRLIRPGDPVLRVRTDANITSVIALFPFGLIKPLRYLKNDDIWQTRFLAPDDLADGTHVVRLILRDRKGHVYREEKSFLISSHPPLVRVHLDATRVRPGDRVALHVQASGTTRTITAQLYGAEPLFLRWDEVQKSNTGMLIVPASLPAGRYSIHVTAEDIAHNVSHEEVPLEVVP